MDLLRLYRRNFRKSLKVYWWRYQYPEKLNFGDELTPLLIERLFGIKTVWAAPDKCDLIGAGSILEVVQELSGHNRIFVWGSGYIRPGDDNSYDNLVFRAVRGKETLKRAGGMNIPLGDPGILTSLAYPEFKLTKKKFKVGIVPHYADMDSAFVSHHINDADILIIDALWPVEKVIEAITSCELIFSSSLHGLIVSDSYSIPNYWMPLSSKLTGGSYKFNDYYSVFNRQATPIGYDEYNNLDVGKLINAYTPIKDLREIQESLIRAFPY